jgi:hypothetical protein
LLTGRWKDDAPKSWKWKRNSERKMVQSEIEERENWGANDMSGESYGLAEMRV